MNGRTLVMGSNTTHIFRNRMRRGALVVSVALITVVAILAGVWLHSLSARSVKANSIALATNANASISAQLAREFDSLVARVHFIGYLAFRSPPMAVSKTELGQMFIKLAKSTQDFRAIALISPQHNLFWSYGSFPASSDIGAGPSPVGRNLSTGDLAVNHGHLDQLLIYQVDGARGNVVGEVRAEIELDTALAQSGSQAVYAEQTGAPTIAITNSGASLKPAPHNYLPLSVVVHRSPRVKLVAGISSTQLNTAIGHAFFGPLVVLWLAWMLLVGLAIFAVELIRLADINQFRSRREAEAAELLRGLTRTVLDHENLHPLFVDVCQLLVASTGASRVVAQFSPQDGPSWVVDLDGDAGWWEELMSHELDDHDRCWSEVVVGDGQEALIWGFGGAGGQGHIAIFGPTPEGGELIKSVNLGVLDIAVDRDETVTQRNFMAAAVEAIDAGVAIFNRYGKLQWANSFWYSLCGVSPGVDADSSLHRLADGRLVAEIETYVERLVEGPSERLTAEFPFSPGSVSPGSGSELSWGSLVLSTVKDERTGVVAHIVALLRDATEAHEETQSLAFQLDHDSLTGTLSRFALEAKAESLIAASPALTQPFAIAIIDVDNFKLVNDTWGHAVGDQLLVGIGSRLQECLGNSHSVGRFGGDEFVLIFCLSEASVEECAAAIDSAFLEPFTIDRDLSIVVKASMGVARYPGDAVTLDSLLREADRSLYHVKSSKPYATRWWLARSELESSETIEQDPWSAASAQRLDRYANVWSTLVDLVETGLRGRIDDRAKLPVNTENRDWIDLHVALLGQVLRADSSPASMGTILARVGAELEVASADKDLLSVTSSLVPSAFLDDRVGPVIAGHERRLVVEVVRRRFEWLVESEREAMTAVRANYLAAAMGASLAAHESWDSYLDATLDQIAGLPSIQGVVFILSDSHDDSGLRYLGGRMASDLRSWIGSADEGFAIFDPSSPVGPGDGALAWESNLIVSVGDVLAEDRYLPWRSVISQLGFRSVCIVPIMVGIQAIGLCVIHGVYTNQFHGRTPEEFVEALQRSLEVGWTRYHSNAGTLTGQRAQRYRKALAHGGLREHLQPLVDLNTGTVTRVEMLARLEVGDDRPAQPGEFLPAFGPRELGHLFVDSLIRATSLQHSWADHGLNLGCSINLPGSVLVDDRLGQVIDAARQRCGGDLSWLTLELLEGEHLAAGAVETLRMLADEGIEFAIDDLGSGYSNFDRLVELPFSQVKLDRSIVKRLWSHPLSTLAIVDGVIESAHEAHRSVVLEGVERVELLEVAQILRADFAQGFVIAKPMPADELAAWLSGYSLPEGIQGAESVFGGRISSVLGALAYVWREVHQHGDGLPNDWRDCPVETYLDRVFGTTSPTLALHRRLHQEGLVVSETYQRLSGELDRCQRVLLSGSTIGPEAVSPAELVTD